MTERRALHETYRIERTYPVPPAAVFAAFATEQARTSWGDTDAVLPPGGTGGDGETSGFDFRVGGREFFSDESEGTTFFYDATFCDIVPDARIVYTYEVHANGTRFSVSGTTVEFTSSGGGTRLVWTGQGVWLDGYDGAEAATLRKDETDKMPDGLALYLQRHPAG
jgi:uncharacterized protein YndB with AHSA1/START domain